MRPVWIRKVGTVEGSSLSSLTLSCWRIPGMGRLFPTEVKWSKCVGHYPPHPVQGCVNSFTLLKGWINLARDYFCCPCCWEKEDNVFLNIYLDMSTCQHVNLSKCQSLQLVNLESVLRELDPFTITLLLSFPYVFFQYFEGINDCINIIHNSHTANCARFMEPLRWIREINVIIGRLSAHYDVKSIDSTP